MKRAVIWILLLAAVLSVVGAEYLRHTGLSARGRPGSVETFLAGKARSFAIPDAARAARNPAASNAQVLTEALQHYADHCALCHANDGSGDTLIGRGLYPPPPDLRRAATQDLTDGEIYWVIHNGIRFTGMPAFGEEKPGVVDKDSWKLVHFIRHLPKISDEELQTLKRFNPKSQADLDEEEQIRKFLAGEDVPATPHAHDD
jgi:mono/diheme cytochrome c family protein